MDLFAQIFEFRGTGVLNKRPLFGIAFFYCLGILTVYNDFNIIIVSALIILIGVLAFFVKQSSFMISLLCVISFMIAMFLTGVEIGDYERLEFWADEKYGVSAVVVDRGQAEEYQLLTLDVHHVNDEEIDFKMYLYVYETDEIYDYGDEVYVITKLREPQAARFRGDFNSKLYAKLLGSFKANTRFDELKEQLAANNLVDAERTAHTIKGVVANLSLSEAYAMALDVEMDLKAGTFSDEKVEALGDCIEKTVLCIDKFVSDLG